MSECLNEFIALFGGSRSGPLQGNITPIIHFKGLGDTSVYKFVALKDSSRAIQLQEIRQKMKQDHFDISIVSNDEAKATVSTLREKLVKKPPWPSHCCIFLVASTIRRHNANAYEPQLVSIGPYHRHQMKLQEMQKFKLWYLNCLLNRAPTLETNLECFIEVLRCNLEYCLGCYSEPIDMTNDEFIEMMVLDGCFIIELFRKQASIVSRHLDDPIFRTSYMKKILLTDLLLLENQLPWYVLDLLFNLTASPKERAMFSLAALAFNFFDFNVVRRGVINLDSLISSKHLLDLQRNNLLASYKDINPEHAPWSPIPCVTKLLKAGVQFEVGEPNVMMDVQFNEGVMIIPPIMILDNAESLIRNLIAYEQCDSRCMDKITSYAILMDNLIETGRDLEILQQKGIITFYLSSEDISKFFKRLYNDADVVYYTYAKLSQDVNEYYRARWPRWRVTLLRDYFSNPWRISSFIAAILILLLTFVQTLYSILSY